MMLYDASQRFRKVTIALQMQCYTFSAAELSHKRLNATRYSLGLNAIDVKGTGRGFTFARLVVVIQAVFADDVLWFNLLC